MTTLLHGTLYQIVLDAAARYALDPLLVESVVHVESGGNPWAWNPEPKYRYFWNVATRRPFRPVTAAELDAKTPPRDFPCLAGDRDQEWWGQQASWGLMQVMGAVAREKGYAAAYLPALCDPAQGVDVGAAVLAGHLKWAAGDLEKGLMAYNGGRGTALRRGNPEYPAKVLKILNRLKAGTELAEEKP